jgi:hypothetical protein
MTKFEQFLINKGYEIFIFDFVKQRYCKQKKFSLSTMTNLMHYYIHKSRIIFLNNATEYIFTNEIDVKNIIIFGLNENNHCPTLIYPRPNIEIKRKLSSSDISIHYENVDDSVNIVLQNFDFDVIFDAMYDKSKCLKINI